MLGGRLTGNDAGNADMCKMDRGCSGGSARDVAAQCLYFPFHDELGSCRGCGEAQTFGGMSHSPECDDT